MYWCRSWAAACMHDTLAGELLGEHVVLLTQSLTIAITKFPNINHLSWRWPLEMGLDQCRSIENIRECRFSSWHRQYFGDCYHGTGQVWSCQCAIETASTPTDLNIITRKPTRHIKMEWLEKKSGSGRDKRYKLLRVLVVWLRANIIPITEYRKVVYKSRTLSKPKLHMPHSNRSRSLKMAPVAQGHLYNNYPTAFHGSVCIPILLAENL